MDEFTIFLILFFIWFIYVSWWSSCKKLDIFIDWRLYVDTSTLTNAGYGVFTKSFIPRDTIIEVAHTIFIPATEREYMSTIITYDYTTSDGKNSLVAMGFGSIYNHHKNYNVEWINIDKTMVYRTTRDIYAGEELFINYGPSYFEMRDTPEMY